ncbi:hypothetical protein [Olivibacter sp. XZL3]|uniref:hypothetical protein n=1 Tax=Olivibacter sp. XZL3 TaxID=1735116 RepID=UPI00197FC973|nr:hypothetical protein [Olivibacter sp. XZL3]
MNPGKRVVANTFVLYARMVITMGITLYSTRLVLNALGSVDYGIFNLVSGLILMLSFLNSAMATSTQRYLSFYQGKNDLPMQKKVFFNSLALHVMLGLLIVLVLEIMGFFLFDGALNIPTDRTAEARIIYHFMGGTVFFTILAVPFNGSLVAHENMLWIAIVNIVETLLKLGIALLLFIVVSVDKLVLYGLLTAGISIITLILYASFCFLKYEECSIFPLNKSKVEKEVLKSLSSFAGWNLVGALCGIGKTQGLAVVLNTRFGAAINASYGIANQVSGQLNFFSSTMLRAINPQIMKSEGSNDRSRMIRLSITASKFGFVLLAFVGIPSLLEMPKILALWLGNVPDNAVLFCSLVLIAVMVNQATIGLDSAAQASGKIKIYMLTVGLIKLLIVPCAILMLNFRRNLEYVMWAYVVLEFLAGICRVIVLEKIIGLSKMRFFKEAVLPLLVPAVVTVFVGNYIVVVMDETLTRLLVVFGSCITTYLGLSYFLTLSRNEKQLIAKLFNSVRSKLFTRLKLSGNVR